MGPDHCKVCRGLRENTKLPLLLLVSLWRKDRHGAGIDGIPGQWNKAWADFIARNPTATRQQLFDFAGQLMKRYGISSSEIHPYGKLP